MKERRKDCKYCGAPLTTGNRNRQFCCDQHRVYWNRESKSEGGINVAEKTVSRELVKDEAGTNSLDNRRALQAATEEVSRKATPIDIEANKPILAQIRQIEAEKIPESRNTVMGRKSWKLDQNKKIEELKKQLV